MDWKKDLENKARELNLEKGGENVHTRTDSGVGSGSSIGRISGSICLSPDKKINNNVTEKGGKKVITVEGALKDLEAIEVEAQDSGSKAVVKALKVVVKFLSTMRSNQLLTEGDKQRISADKAKRAVEKK
jgi:hypothetical protein